MGDSKRIDSGRASVDPGWFGDFSEAESTFSEDGIAAHEDVTTERLVVRGHDPADTFRDARARRSGTDRAWFHESPSAGSHDAWQTHFPVVDGGVDAGSRGVHNNPWRYTPEGWVEDYIPEGVAMNGAGGRPASWFDSSVAQIDGFGRGMMPTESSGERYPGWQERAVNTSFACEAPGCTARASLQAFDAAKEAARHCRLNVYVHPTDYDDDYSKEVVEFVSANGKVLTRNVNPNARGCNTTTQRPLYPCVNDFHVDAIIDSTGTLVVEAKNSLMVDECPYEGHLLSGLAIVTCLVPDAHGWAMRSGGRPGGRPGGLPDPALWPFGPGGLCPGPKCPCPGPDCPCPGPTCPCPGPECPCPGVSCPCPGPSCPWASCPGPLCPVDTACPAEGPCPPGQGVCELPGPCPPEACPLGCAPSPPPGAADLGLSSGPVPLRCATPGCVGTANVFIDPAWANNGGTCFLTVNVTQTDYDQDNGVREVIEYVRLEGDNLVTDFAPGLNPCTDSWTQGAKIDEDLRIMTLVKDLDVTDRIVRPLWPAVPGHLRLTGKISENVDECGTPWLLDAMASVTCHPPPQGLYTPTLPALLEAAAGVDDDERKRILNTVASEAARSKVEGPGLPGIVDAARAAARALLPLPAGDSAAAPELLSTNRRLRVTAQ